MHRVASSPCADTTIQVGEYTIDPYAIYRVQTCIVSLVILLCLIRFIY